MSSSDKRAALEKAQVPSVDIRPEGSVGDGNSTRNASEAEFRLLDAEAKAKEKLNREADQRYFLRWASVIVGLLLIVVMAFVLYHMSHKIFFGSLITVPSSYAMTLVVAPIVSMTTVTIALLVAAFRGFSKDDDASAGQTIAEGAKATFGLGN